VERTTRMMWRALGQSTRSSLHSSQGYYYNKSGEFLVEWEGTRWGRHDARTLSEAVNNNLQMSRKMHNYIQSRNYSINKVLHIFLWIFPLTVSLHIFPTSSSVSFSSIYLQDRPLSPHNYSLFLFHHHLFLIPFQDTSIIGPQTTMPDGSQSWYLYLPSRRVLSKDGPEIRFNRWTIADDDLGVGKSSRRVHILRAE
jgi:hypothetical protein